MAGHLPGVHLTTPGQEQAQKLGDAFKDIPLAAIFSSPLDRAMETAAPVAAACRLNVIIEPGLIETKIGNWQGRSHKSLSLARAWKNVQSSPSRFRFPGGESFHECQARVVTTLEAILCQYKSDDLIACVFHADPIKLAVAYFLGMPLDNFQRLGCDTGSVTCIYFQETITRLILLNQHPPLNLLKELAGSKNFRYQKRKF